ncbi:MAG: hypothetical protein AABX03_00350 [Nanoarchaeota archaeon]
MPSIKNRNFTKKAVSDVITNVLLIFLIVTIVSLFGFLVNNLLKDNLEFSPEISCIKMQATPPITIEDVCFNTETNTTQAVLKSSTIKEYSVGKFSMILELNAGTEKYTCGNSCGSCEVMSDGETKKYYLKNSVAPSKISLIIDSCIIETDTILSC